jgi:hypothetical protein
MRVPTLKVRALIAKSDPLHSSSRTVAEVVEIFRRANEIWRQAGIQFDASVSEFKFDPAMLEEVVQAARQRLGDADALTEITGQEPREITGIFLRSIGGSNGKVFRPKKTFVIVDKTTMPDYRTTAHEMGHFFGLEHWLDHPPPEPPDRPPNQLMARTQMGTELTARDIEEVKGRLAAGGFELV